jgi:hypothetical protein
MRVCMKKLSMYFNIQSERFFLVHRSSLGHLETVLRRILSGQSRTGLVNSTNLCGV